MRDNSESLDSEKAKKLKFVTRQLQLLCDKTFLVSMSSCQVRHSFFPVLLTVFHISICVYGFAQFFQDIFTKYKLSNPVYFIMVSLL